MQARKKSERVSWFQSKIIFEFYVDQKQWMDGFWDFELVKKLGRV